MAHLPLNVNKIVIPKNVRKKGFILKSFRKKNEILKIEKKQQA